MSREKRNLAVCAEFKQKGVGLRVLYLSPKKFLANFGAENRKNDAFREMQAEKNAKFAVL